MCIYISIHLYTNSWSDPFSRHSLYLPTSPGRYLVSEADTAGGVTLTPPELLKEKKKKIVSFRKGRMANHLFSTLESVETFLCIFLVHIFFGEKNFTIFSDSSPGATAFSKHRSIVNYSIVFNFEIIIKKCRLSIKTLILLPSKYFVFGKIMSIYVHNTCPIPRL